MISRSNSNVSVTRENVFRLYQEHCIYLPPMMGWFIFSSLLSTYNKYVFGDTHMAFPCPLLLTSVHFSIQWAISYILCELFPVTMGTERLQRMTISEWAKISIPCGLVTAFDVGLSNLSLKFITLTFYTMIKSSTPIFVLGWAYVFGIERITHPLIGVIMVICLGEFLTVMGEVDFQFKGFATCLVASMLSGARWTLVQLKLQTMDPPLKSTLVTMRLLAPCMFWSMLLFSFIVERPWKTLPEAALKATLAAAEASNDGEGFDDFNAETAQVEESFSQLRLVFFLGAVGGLLAVAMVLCEFYLILRSTAMVMMIGGVIKELTTILIGVAYFQDQLNLINVAGICVVFSGVILYKMVFHMEKESREEEAEKLRKGAGKFTDPAYSDVSGDDDDDGYDNISMNGGGTGDLNGRNGDHIMGTKDEDNTVAYSPRVVELVDRSNGKHMNHINFSKMTTETIPNIGSPNKKLSLLQGSSQSIGLV